MSLKILSENTLILNISDEIKLENYYILKAMEAQLLKIDEVIETRHGYTDLLIEVKSLTVYDQILEMLEERTPVKFPETIELIEIPVCYDAPFALDQEAMISHTQLAWTDIIKRHTENIYFVYFLGFTLGFPYLGGLDEAIAVPRKSNPRLKIEAGSVGIAGMQTGIYPSQLPGGWQIIGKTPIPLYDEKGSTLLEPGLAIRFKQISKETFCEEHQLVRQVIPWPF